MNTLFTDLGEVILFYEIDAFHGELRKHSELDESEINTVFKHWLRQCLKGETSIKKTHEGIIRDARLNMSQRKLKKLWDAFWTPNLEFMEFLKDWKTKDRKLYLISNINSLSWSYFRKNFPIFEIFDDVFLSFRLKLLKPDPEIFFICLEKTGTRPQNSLFIDDQETNIEVAAELGMKIWLYRKETHQKMVDWINFRKGFRPG